MAAGSAVVIGGETVHVRRNPHFFLLAAFQMACLHKPDQFLCRISKAALRLLHIELHRLTASVYRPCIFYAAGENQLRVRALSLDTYRSLRQLELRIRKTISERVQHRIPGKRLKITIPHINIFLIHIFRNAAMIPIRRVIRYMPCNGVRELSLEHFPARQHIGNSVSAFHAALPRIDYRPHSRMFLHKLHIHDVGNI